MVKLVGLRQFQNHKICKSLFKKFFFNISTIVKSKSNRKAKTSKKTRKNKNRKKQTRKVKRTGRTRKPRIPRQTRIEIKIKTEELEQELVQRL